MPQKKPTKRTPSEDYREKAAHEAARLARRARAAGLREPLGLPTPGGVLLVAEPPGYAAEDRALALSLSAVGLEEAYVTRASGEPLREELHALEPQVLVAVGPEAARALDGLHNPLANSRFLDAPEGSWFAWTRGTRGLRTPALTPALRDENAKRRFWRAFLALRAINNA